MDTEMKKGPEVQRKNGHECGMGQKKNQTSVFFSGEVSQDKVRSAHILTARLFRRRVEMSN